MKVSYYIEETDPKSPPSPGEGRWSLAALLQQQSCQGCGWAQGDKQAWEGAGEKGVGIMGVCQGGGEVRLSGCKSTGKAGFISLLLTGNFLKLFSQNFLIFSGG